MFLHLNQEIKNIHGSLSLKGLQARFFSPEIYYVTTIGDFIEHRREIQPTDSWRFSSLGIDAYNHNAALVIINSAFYKATRSMEALLKVAREQAKIEPAQEKETELGKEIEKILEGCEPYYDKVMSYHGSLYDSQHYCSLFVPKEFHGKLEDNQRIYDVFVSYVPFSDLMQLTGYSDHGPSILEKSLDRIDLVRRFAAIPLPSPA